MEFHPEAQVITVLASIQAHGGPADEYFQGAQQSQYGQQQQFQTAPPQQQYPPPPSKYSPEPVSNANGERMDFNQTFRIVKPRYNDIWATLLFIATLAGFVVVSAFAIHGYSATKLFQGGSIYGGASTVGLSTNTIILL